ncbi:PadR family transcriptional regulator [Chloroflexota bacterium]
MIKQLLLLGVLMNGKMHGYRLNEYVKHVMNFYTDLKKSTVYYILNQLEKDGYISYALEREGKRPERRIYELTDKGRVFFYELLRDSLSSYAQTSFGDDIAVSFIDSLPPKEVRELLIGKRQKIKDQLKTYKGIGGHSSSLQYVINHNIAHLETDISWVDGILNEIEREN